MFDAKRLAARTNSAHLDCGFKPVVAKNYCDADPYRSEVSQLDMHIVDGKIAAYRAKVKVSFKYEG